MEKRQLVSFLVYLLSLSLMNSSPVHRNEEDKHQEEDVMDSIIRTNQNAGNNFYEGDIILTSQGERDQSDIGDEDDSQYSKRNARRSRVYLWKSKVIPYEILIPDEDGSYKRVIQDAIAEFHKHTCLRFVQRTNEDKWIKFVQKSGCSSSVGMQFYSKGGQEISLGKGCEQKGVVMHELLHALGFWHEQSRPDRNQYVEVFWENIKKAEQHNFQKYTHGAIDTLKKPYDYKSIMHYSRHSFSKNGKPTILGLGANKHTILGQRDGFSKTDIFEINALYDCSGPSNGWSSWSDFGPCEYNCKKTRERFCATADRSACPGADSWGLQKENKKCSDAECYAPVDGHWGKWSDWSQCSVTCDSGTHTRTRMCDDPSPKNNGKQCVGNSKETGACHAKACRLGPDDCEFEFGMCSWFQVDKKNGYKWKRTTGKTPSSTTGPNGDASVNQNGQGHYVFAESSSPARTGNVAKLRSKVFPAAPKGRCIKFAYSMYGSGIGALNVYVIDSKTGKKTKLFSKSGDQGPGWHRTNASIATNDDYRISFEVTRGNSFLGDIALDDITFKNGGCYVTPPTIPPTTSAPATSAPTTSAPMTSAPTTSASGDDFKSLGCFNDKQVQNARPFPKIIANLRDDGSLDWKDLKTSVVDRCARIARNLGYKYFGIQYYGECWSGPDSQVHYDRDGSSKQCWGGVGKGNAFMVYKFT